MQRAISIFLLFIVLLSGCTPPKKEFPQVQLRGVWVQGKSLNTRDGVNAVIQKAQAGGFNQIFVGVFGSGTTVYPSRIAVQKDDIDVGFDPLAYLVQEAHSRGIEVHAWFAVGRIANNKDYSVVIEKHPDWGLVGPDGKTMPWLNFTNPDARQFVSDVMMEAVARGVDGLHFDYTRYPDAEWGFDEYSIELFNQQHDYYLNELRYTDLPAYGQFEGNALLMPSTAQVLAKFSNGFPAVMLNQYRDGKVLILNWQAGERKTAIGSEILKRGIGSYLENGRKVHILRSEMNIAKYGTDTVTSVTSWLNDLGWDTVEVLPEDLGVLDPDSVLVLPYVYLFSELDAERLAEYVGKGGFAIFIDSPTPSIKLKDIQSVTGMQPIHKYYKDWLLMTPLGDHPLIPISDRTTDMAFYEKRNAEWSKFREVGINTLIHDIYKRVKTEHPNVLLTVTITSDQEQAALEDLQDWRAWLEGGYIDALIPRAYENSPDNVKAIMDLWLPDLKKYGRMTFGVIAFIDENDNKNPKPPAELIKEIQSVLDAGSNGFMVFDLDHMTDEQLNAVANFSMKTP